MRPALRVEIFQCDHHGAYFVRIAGEWLTDPCCGRVGVKPIADFNVTAADVRKKAAKWITALL